MIALLATLPLAAGAQDPAPARVERRLALMGTTLELWVEARSRAVALNASEAAVRALEAAEARLSTWTADSELARLNRAPVGQPFPLSAPLARELARARSLWASTDGAFDPGLGALVRAWGLREGGRRPTEEELEAALAPRGLASLQLEGDTALRRHPALVLEEGGFGKGAGLDAALAALGGAGATGALLDLGGQLAVLGGARARLAVAHPDRRDLPVVEVTVDAGSLATSGNSERGMMLEGERLGHLLDPRTGRPAPDFGSVTVWAADGLTADALSTGLFVLGPGPALAWAAEHPGVEVLVLRRDRDSGKLIARASAGLAQRARPLAPDLRIDFEPAGEPSDSEPRRHSDAPTALAQDGAIQEPQEGAAQEERDQERRLRELEERFEALSSDVEGFELRDVIPPLGEQRYGMGPAASKVYGAPSGLSIGGYGELRYRNFEDTVSEFDDLRTVLYFGYKFDERWVFNSEIELEHADESFVEFAYVDYLHDDAASFRTGLLLTPMGLVNEVHEPTTFLAANRPLTESYIIPSTWRENGAGVFGELGGFDYKLYVMNGFEGEDFGGKTGLRGGRQNGSKAKADDFAVVGSLNWTATPGWLLGASVYTGDAGQDAGMGDMQTTILEAHGEYRSGPFWGRALFADASVDDRDAGDLDLGGWYVEGGWDLLAENERQALYAYLRYEGIDTDEGSGGIDDTTITVGLHYRPMDNVVIKLDHTDYDDDADEDVTTLLIGYVF